MAREQNEKRAHGELVEEMDDEELPTCAERRVRKAKMEDRLRRMKESAIVDMVEDLIHTSQTLQGSVIALERKMESMEAESHRTPAGARSNKLGGVSAYSSVSMLKRFAKMKNYFHFDVNQASVIEKKRQLGLHDVAAPPASSSPYSPATARAEWRQAADQAYVLAGGAGPGSGPGGSAEVELSTEFGRDGHGGSRRAISPRVAPY